ncbi:MAG: tetratricopeptide repeat protein [Acidobacteriota bacterium]
MSDSRSLPGRYPLCVLLIVLLFGANAADVRGAQQGQVPQGGTFVIFGRISLPDGRPPKTRMKVFAEAMNGMKRDIFSDEDGNYEFRGMTRGRYRVYAINPDVPEQYCDPLEADTNRSYANRVQVDISLKLPLHRETPDANPGTVSAAEAAQNIPKSARKAYEDALKLQKANRGDEALTQFSQAIELYPEYFQALTERSNLLMQRSQLAEAEAGFARALELNSKYPPALRGIGYCQIQQKKFAPALSNLEKAFVLEPKIPLTLLLLGYANLSLDRYEEAKQSLQQALKLGPDSASRAHVYLAEVYVHEQKFKDAADSIRTYLKLKPDASDAAHLRELEAQWRARSKPATNQP